LLDSLSHYEAFDFPPPKDAFYDLSPWLSVIQHGDYAPLHVLSYRKSSSMDKVKIVNKRATA
jgi:hypothetical protein